MFYFVIFHFTLPEQVFLCPDRHLTMWQNYEFTIRLCAFSCAYQISNSTRNTKFQTKPLMLRKMANLSLCALVADLAIVAADAIRSYWQVVYFRLEGGRLFEYAIRRVLQAFYRSSFASSSLLLRSLFASRQGQKHRNRWNYGRIKLRICFI